MAKQQNVFPHRDKEIQHLKGIFGKKDSITLPCVFIYGQKSCGKSLVVSTVLKQLPHVTINCIECYASSLIFETILREIGILVDDLMDIRCTNSNDFVRILKSQLNKYFKDQTFYLVFDKPEYLRDLDDFLLPVITNLQSITGCNLCCILTSDLPWNKFTGNVTTGKPYQIFFPHYTKTQLVDILCYLKPLDTNDDFYRQFIHFLLDVFSLSCNDLQELHHLAKIHFVYYRQPVDEGKLKKDDHRRLCRLIEGRLKQSLHDICHKSDENHQNSSQVPKKSSLLVELPFYTKYLLISAYIASFNPPTSDKRFFLKNAGKMKKKIKNASVLSTKTNCHLQGPHSFPLNRMLAIFYSIIDGRVAPTINLFSQITNLVSLQLITRISREDEIDSPKYKCLVSIESITAISKTVNFEILKYLFDFI